MSAQSEPYPCAMRGIPFGTRHPDQAHNGSTLGGSVQALGVLSGEALECVRIISGHFYKTTDCLHEGGLRFVEAMGLSPDPILKFSISGSQPGDDPAHG